MNSSIKTYNLPKSLPLELELKDIAEIKKMPMLFSGPCKAASFLFIWISKGSMNLCVDFREMILKAGQALLISSGQIYGIDIASDCEGKLILFTENFYCRTETDRLFLYHAEILNPLSLNRTILLSADYMKPLLELFRIKLKHPSDSFQADIVQHILSTLLLESEKYILQQIQEDCHYTKRGLAYKFILEVEHNFKISKQVEFYVQKLDIHEKTLSRAIKERTGKTPKQYIETRIILEAKRLLAYSKMTAKEICFELGCDEATNFNKFFRKHTGLTPLEFRKNHSMLPAVH